MAILLTDSGKRKQLMPLTLTRPIAELRPGILTIAESWQQRTGEEVSFATDSSLENQFPAKETSSRLVYGGLLCTGELATRVMSLTEGQLLTANGVPVACCAQGLEGNELENTAAREWETIELGHIALMIERPWHLFQHCGQAIAVDMEVLCNNRNSATLSSTNTVIGDAADVFLEDGAEVEACVLNTTNGPIYIGKDAVMMEGSKVRGPFSLGEKAQLKMGTRVYGPSAFGPQCRVGGEVCNSVMLGYSNKGHDGFLGNSVLGEWCNLGADTNNSNLKNNYGEVRVYDYSEDAMIGTGLQFCGLIMGDHSKAGINTMFNTGTVVGVCANVFGGGFPPKHIPSFSWGGADGFVPYEMEKALTTAHHVMERRGKELSEEEITLLQEVRNQFGLGQ